jgi:hypothetical protein
MDFLPTTFLSQKSLRYIPQWRLLCCHTSSQRHVYTALLQLENCTGALRLPNTYFTHTLAASKLGCCPLVSDASISMHSVIVYLVIQHACDLIMQFGRIGILDDASHHHHHHHHHHYH